VFSVAIGYIDVDCGLRESDIPSVSSVLDTPACCSMQCEGDDDCIPREDRCAQVSLQTINAVYDARCRFQVKPVRLLIIIIIIIIIIINIII